MSAYLSIMRADIRGVIREGILVFVVALILVAVIATRFLVIYQAEWGTGPFLAPVMIGLLLLFAAGFGMIMGFLLVEESDSGVRDALSVAPLSISGILLFRGGVSYAGALIACAIAILIIQGVSLPVWQWAGLLLTICLLAPTMALIVAAISSNKIVALVIFRGLFAFFMAPAVSFILTDEWYRYVFLISPPGFVIEAYRALLTGNGPAELWLLGGAVYSLAILRLAAWRFQRVVYGLNR
jgi:hypothetical protein